MAVIRPTDDEFPELYDESLLLEVEKSTENADCGGDDDDDCDQRLNSSPHRGFSSAPFSHWSQSWSKPTETCRDSEQPQFTLLPYDAPADEPARESAETGIELLPSSSLSNNSNRALMVRLSSFLSIVRKVPLVFWIHFGFCGVGNLQGAGLDNLGNTCFLNSVLQCFIHTVPLLQPILSNGHPAHSSNNCKLVNAKFDFLFHAASFFLRNHCIGL